MNLFAEFDGKYVPLNDCGWVLWGPCGCPFGVTVAGIHGGVSVVTEDEAWAVFYEDKRELAAALTGKQRLELMTETRIRSEVLPRFAARCEHKEAAS